jgi:nucleotidyltransferase/DNA polymerase involved in DNA repair
VDLRDHLKAGAGVPVTVGPARSKSLAKLVSDTAKPFGARALTDPDAEWELLGRLAVTEITGIAGLNPVTFPGSGNPVRGPS